MTTSQILLSSPNWTSAADGRIRFWSSTGPQQAVPEAQLLAKEFDKIPGNWAAIVEGQREITLIADRCRSHSILYSQTVDGWVISDSPSALRQVLPTWRLDSDQAEVFEALGYTLNDASLIEGVRSVEAGSSTRLSDGCHEHETLFYGVFRFNEQRVADPSQFGNIFAAALDEAVGSVVRDARGRELVVPLSGGIDSRLLATWLRRLDAPNVTTFTYGVEGAAEVEVSRSIAEQLQLPWTFIPYSPTDLRRAWFSKEADAFMEETWGGTSLPHVQDWYALRQMREQGLVSPHAIMLPGHSVTGKMHHEHLLDAAAAPAVAAAAAAAHHSLRTRPPRSLRNSSSFRRAFGRAMAQTRYTREPGRVQDAFVWFNLRERQGKYINNSMRAYEYFGWDWALPMCTAPVWAAWSEGAASLTATRAWYGEFTARHFREETAQDAPYFAPPASALPTALKDHLLNVMRIFGLHRVLSRYRSIKSMLAHPLAFQAFVRTASPLKTVAEYATGQTTVGFWAKSFLNNQWGSRDCDIVPSKTLTSGGRTGGAPETFEMPSDC